LYGHFVAYTTQNFAGQHATRHMSTEARQTTTKPRQTTTDLRQGLQRGGWMTSTLFVALQSAAASDFSRMTRFFGVCGVQPSRDSCIRGLLLKTR
jgi:hypothetical protein